MKLTLTLTMTMALAGASSAFASGFTGLCNTGVSGPCASPTGVGTGLAPVGNEQNWVGTGFQALVPTSIPWPNLGSSASQWISPTANTFTNGNTIYTYTLQFMVGSLANLSSGVINGRYASDNGATSVLLNGNAIPGFPLTLDDASAFSQWHNFTINSGFQTGVNTLSFSMSNGNFFNPQGLRVEFSDANISDTPEPSTLLLGGAGLAAVGLAQRRRKKG